MSKKTSKFLCGLIAVAVTATAFAFTACGDNPKENNGDGASDYTVMDRAKELAENIDMLPTSGDLIGIEGSTASQNDNQSVKTRNVSSCSAQLSSETVDGGWVETDLTVPGNNYYLSNLINLRFGERLDIAVDRYKTWKDYALEIVWQLGVYVEYGTSKYKIDYDINLDMVTVETFYETGYMKIQSTYNAAGKMVLIGTTSIIIDGRVKRTDTLYFEEDKICTFAETIDYGVNEVVSKEVIEKDYITGKLTVLSLQCPHEGEEGESYGSVMAVTEENGIKVSCSKSASGGYSVGIMDANGYDIAVYSSYPQESEYNHHQIFLPIYKLSGWDKFLSYSKISENYIAGKYKLVIGNKEYESTGEDFKFNDDFYWNFAGVAESAYPDIEILSLLKSDILFPAEKIREFLTSLGLSMDENYLAAIEKNFICYEEVIKNWSAFGYSDYSDFDLNKFDTIYKAENFGAITYAQFQELNNLPCIAFLEQTEENEVFQLIKLDLNSQAKLNTQTGVIDFSSVSATVPKSVLLGKGTEYSLVIALRGITELIEMASVPATYNGEEFTLQGLGSINIKDFVSNGNFGIVAYITKNTDGAKSRASQVYNITSAQAEEYKEEWQEIVKDGKTEKKYDYTYSINASVTGIEVAQYFLAENS